MNQEVAKLKPNSLEAQLLDTLFGGMTEEESKYLAYLLPRVNSGKYTVEKARELFLRKFPNTKWMKH